MYVTSWEMCEGAVRQDVGRWTQKNDFDFRDDFVRQKKQLMNNDMNMSINDKDIIEKFEELKKENARLKQERENFIHQYDGTVS